MPQENTKKILIAISTDEVKAEIQRAIKSQLELSTNKLLKTFRKFEKDFFLKQKSEILKQNGKFIKGKMQTAELLNINIKTLNKRLKNGYYEKGKDYKTAKNGAFYFSKDKILSEREA